VTAYDFSLPLAVADTLALEHRLGREVLLRDVLPRQPG
jgi:hypothetical protein